MRNIFKNLWRHKWMMLIIILLLVVQAYCDLSLPTYTSDIVDVGLQQSGISDSVMEKMRQATFEKLCLFVETDDEQTLRSEYNAANDGTYVLSDVTSQEREHLDSIMTLPEVMIYSLENGDTDGASYFDAQTLTDMGADIQKLGESGIDITSYEGSALDMILELTQSGIINRETFRTYILEREDELLERYGNSGGSILSQVSVQFVGEEYTACGIDLNEVQKSYLFRTGGMMLVFAAIGLCASVIVAFFASRTAASIGREMREGIFKKVMSFSNEQMDQFSTASLITRTTNDIQQVQLVTVMLLRMVLYAPIVGIGAVIKVLSSHTGLEWLIILAVCLLLGVVIVLMFLALPKFKMVQKLIDRINLISRETLTGVSVIRAFGREKHEEERFSKANSNLMRTQLFSTRAMMTMMPAMMFIMNFISVLIVWFGGRGVDLGNLQVGDMMAFITYTIQIIIAFLMISMISVMLPRAGVAADRIHEVAVTPATILDPSEPQGESKNDWRGVVQFNHVCFKYKNAERDAIHDINFTAMPGQTTAIIGSTGSGKSTLVNLIARFYDVTEGSITIDGIDVRDMTQNRLRALLGFVPQKGVLFSGTIMDNLKFGGNHISDDDAKKAAEIAQATEFIDASPAGFERPISQGGTNVSGGQKQRLSIARAIAGHPKICIFDDSFSALDMKTDAMLRSRLNKELGDSTIIIVAQRVSTILNADRIIVLEDGNVMGCGTHSELMKTCGTYQEIARSQLSEKELEGEFA